MNNYPFYIPVMAAFISVIGLIANIIYGENAKRRTKVWEARLARCDEQIGKFYAPLRKLVDQLGTTDELKEVLIAQDQAHADQISKLMYDKYFQDIHNKIALILENQMHLLEGKTIPESFNTYHAHVASEKVVFSLVDTLKAAKASGALPADAANITASPVPFPKPKFKEDINRGFHIVMERQERLLALISQNDSYGRRIRRVKRWLRQISK